MGDIMKENKIAFYISMLVCIITLSISIYLNFCIKTELAIYISNILLNIFVSSSVIIFTSLIYYFVERRKLLVDLMHECSDLINIYSSLKYIDKENVSNNLKLESAISKISKKELKLIEDNIIKDEINKYTLISNYNLRRFWDIYDKLSFIRGKNIRLSIYNQVFDYTRVIQNRISGEVLKLEMYCGDKITNKKYIYDKLFELETIVFSEESSSFNYNNKVVEYYYQVLNRLGKMAYFDKKYQYIKSLDN